MRRTRFSNAHMNMRLTRAIGTIALLAIMTSSPVPGAEGPAKNSRPAIYDETADGKRQIADALAVAKKEKKRVLVQFGANWCGWCHKLHKLFQTDPQIAAKLKAAYVLVLVDVNKGHNEDTDKRYGNPTRLGLPALVVVYPSGK